MIVLSCTLVLIFFIIRTESYALRQWCKKTEKEIMDAFVIKRATRYEPSKYLVIFK